VLAASLLAIAPSPASAQEARGSFTLMHDVRWEKATIPAGEYGFSYDASNPSPVLVLSKLNGARAGFMMLVPATERTKASGGDRLVLESTPEGSYVSAMELPGFGITLEFNVPSRVAEKQLAKAVTTASAGQ
jgi:hypothetical protein